MPSLPQTPPPDLAEALASDEARLGGWGRVLAWYAEISSTNDVAVSLAETGADEGVVVAADMQHAGRGRVGRHWFSPPGAGVYLSCVLRPPPGVARLLTVAAGLGVAEGVERATGLSPLVKWPNDLLLGHRKVGGILAEAGTSRDGRPFVVLGVGVNVTPHALPRDLVGVATSLEAERGGAVDRARVFVECLAGVRARYADLGAGLAPIVVDGWRARAQSIVGRAVEWDMNGRVRAGVVDGIADDAALLIRCDDGQVRVTSGEVRWR